MIMVKMVMVWSKLVHVVMMMNMVMVTMQRRTAMRQTITQTGRKALSM